jgi:DNA ligase (NAD+)
MGKKSAANIVAAIDRSKSRPLPNVLFALGIRHVGSETAELLVRRFGSLQAIAEANVEALTAVPGIGPKVAESVYSYFHADSGEEEGAGAGLVARLLALGVGSQVALPAPQSDTLAGEEFVFTGRLERLTRSAAEAMVKDLGARAASNVTRKTTRVVVGEEAGSKAERAQALGIPQMTEQEFLTFLEATGRPAPSTGGPVLED